MKKSLFPIVVWPLFLLGCITSEAMFDREPILTAKAAFPKADFRDCIFRWADNPGLRLQYHPDGVWIRDNVGGAVALVTQIDDHVRLYHHWNAAPLKKHLIFLTEVCNGDVNLRPPKNYWGTTPRVRRET